jgi:lipopolysaccharide transport system ATP-binding protein
MQKVIKVENISKVYRLGQIGTGTLLTDIDRWWKMKVLGKEDPYLKIGETNDRSQKGGSVVFSLRDINFEVEQGDAIGIIGRNGAGKSTLLKILSRITSPTTGNIKIKGRVASLLEVGTGFHPELTGRENIYLNGAILGMRKHEISRKMDEIIAFSGIERYIDTPVKRYSSGMYVRLAFAVAAHLESEIMIVDEVLAVGDMEFQKKCLGKMNDVTKQQGRTVLFVSHNIAAVKSLCNKGIVLNSGNLIFNGSQSEAVSTYHAMHASNSEYYHSGPYQEALGNNNIRVLAFSVKPADGGDIIEVSTGFIFEVEFFNNAQDINLDVTFELKTIDDTVVFHNGKIISSNKDSYRGRYKVSGFVGPYLLNSGTYKFNIIFGENANYVLCYVQDIVSFEISNEAAGVNLNNIPGIIRLPLEFKFSLIDSK